jgi:hypothetical protein
MYPQRLWHTAVLQVVAAADTLTVIWLMLLLANAGFKYEVYGGYGVMSAMTALSVRGAVSMMCNSPEVVGESMFRVMAAEILTGSLGLLAVLVPTLWRTVLQRGLDYRRLDGDRFEKMELWQIVFVDVPKAGGIFRLLWALDDIQGEWSSSIGLVVCGATTALAMTIRLLRWCLGGVVCCSTCRPCCLRCCGAHCKYLMMEPPYPDAMWSNLRLDSDGARSKAATDTRVHPLSSVIRYELSCDKGREALLHTVPGVSPRAAGTPGSPMSPTAKADMSHLTFRSYQIMEALETGACKDVDVDASFASDAFSLTVTSPTAAGAAGAVTSPPPTGSAKDVPPTSPGDPQPPAPGPQR